MKCALAVVLISTAALAQTVDPREFLAKVCPARPVHRLSADEQAILDAVAAHYRRFEWVATRTGAFAHVDYARHAVPSLKSPQILCLDTWSWANPMAAAMDSAIEGELERHGVSAEMAKTLRARNEKGVELAPPKGWEGATLRCADVYSAFFQPDAKPLKDPTNAAKAITISLPAFDASRTRALILSFNNIESYLEGGPETELIYLSRAQGGAWKIDWHVALGECVSRVPRRESATADDLAVLEAVVRHLDGKMIDRAKPLQIVNQTKRWAAMGQFTDRTFLDAESAKALASRNGGCAWMGAFAPARKAELVQREAMSEPRPRGAIVRFTLPGYAGTRAVVSYAISRNVAAGIETGEGIALLEKVEGTWRVKRDTYQRAMLAPHR